VSNSRRQTEDVQYVLTKKLPAVGRVSTCK